MPSMLARSLALTALALATAPALHAQALERTGVLVAPHFTQYTIGSGTAERTMSQMAVPFMVELPFSDRFSVDVTTAFATSKLSSDGATESEISGLTDTQIRANLALAGRMLVFTFGINIPTGQYTVDDDQAEAAGQIGNDFLNYPISSMGNGFAGTGGVAFARAMGSWNVGMGASMRKSTEFAAYALAASEFRFTPADEYRVRIGADRPVGDGEVALGLAYSAYGADAIDTTTDGSGRTTASTGDRITLNGMWMRPLGRGELYVSGWNLFRLKGQRFGGDAPGENVANLNVAYSIEAGRVLLQPSVEGRFWQVDGDRAGQLTNLDLRLRLEASRFVMFPSVGYSIGSLYDTGGASIDLSGIRGSLTIRLN